MSPGPAAASRPPTRNREVVVRTLEEAHECASTGPRDLASRSGSRRPRATGSGGPGITGWCSSSGRAPPDPAPGAPRRRPLPRSAASAAENLVDEKPQISAWGGRRGQPQVPGTPERRSHDTAALRRRRDTRADSASSTEVADEIGQHAAQDFTTFLYDSDVPCRTRPAVHRICDHRSVPLPLRSRRGCSSTRGSSCLQPDLLLGPTRSSDGSLLPRRRLDRGVFRSIPALPVPSFVPPSWYERRTLRGPPAGRGSGACPRLCRPGTGG